MTWAKGISNVGGDVMTVSTDPVGNIALAGYFSYPGFSVDNFSVTTPASNWMSGMLLKLNSSGTTLWAQTVVGTGTNSIEKCVSACFDNQGGIYVTGSFDCPLFTIGSFSFTNNNNALFNSQLFVAHYSSSGAVTSALKVGDDNTHVLPTIILNDPNGGFHLGGSFSGHKAIFGPVSIYGNNSNNYDALFIAHASSTVTGLSENKESQAIKVVPNPTQSSLIVETDQVIKTIRIYDVTGKDVLTLNCFSPSATVPLENLHPGIYMLEVSTFDNQRTVRRIVKTD